MTTIINRAERTTTLFAFVKLSSSVDIATRYELKVRGSILGRDKRIFFYFTASRQILGLN
jgi:hypothetical protein